MINIVYVISLARYSIKMLCEKDISFSESLFYFAHSIRSTYHLEYLFESYFKKDDLPAACQSLARVISLSVYFATTLYHLRSALLSRTLLYRSV